MAESTNGVSSLEFERAINRLERANEARFAELRGEMRAVKQTLDESVIPTQKEHEATLESLRTRFVYALTVIGSAIGAVVWLYFKGQ